MRPRQHVTNTCWLGAPAGMSPDECTALPITRIEYEDGTPGVASYWQPSAQELELLNAGNPVRLTVLGRTHPPILLGVDGDGVL